jgi:predicted dehydrogenase
MSGKAKIKVGIVGMGAIGTHHADAFKSLPDADLAAICDISEERLKAQGERLGVPESGRFTDYRKLLASGVDAVVVGVGNILHREVAVAAFRAGKHVLVEKPMAMNAREAQDIQDASVKARRALQVGMVWRQAAESKLAREYVEKGVFGEIYHLRAVLIRRRGIPGLGGWFTTKAASGGGPLIDIGVHWFDLAMYVSGLWKPTAVSAMTYAKFGPRMKGYRYVSMWAGPPKYDGVCDVEDYAAGLVRFGAKASMSFEIAWAANSQETGFIEILGDKAGVTLCDGKPLCLLTEHGDRVADIMPKINTNVNRFQSQAAAFLAACRGEASPAATGKEGVMVMKLIDAVYRSSDQGREVKIV